MDGTQVPNPIFARRNIRVLDGAWDFRIIEGGGENTSDAWREIQAPYCPESPRSGVGYTDFIYACAYRKRFVWVKGENGTLLCFGAVDYCCGIFLNGRYIGSHTGGYTPFSFDVSHALSEGENLLEVAVYDNRPAVRAFGKQSYQRKSFGCFYTRTTGIWQPVWLEYAPAARVRAVRFYPDPEGCAAEVELAVTGEGNYEITAFFEGRKVGRIGGFVAGRTRQRLVLSEKHLWECGKGDLYDVEIRYGDDFVSSYFGLRCVRYADYRFLLNGKTLFQRFVLDQGFSAAGIYTQEPEEMERDIRAALRLGFNGARLHQKVFDPRFLYLCDRAGYLVWGEFPGWGVDYSDAFAAGQFLCEWAEAVNRDFNHPSVVTWCPLNETWGDIKEKGKERDVRFVDTVYEFTKKLDPTRPCVDVSGGHHGHATDLYDFHCYEPAETLKGYLDALDQRDELNVPLLYGKEELRYPKGLPVSVSECGGYAFSEEGSCDQPAVNEGAVQSEAAWGYGAAERNAEAFVERYRRLVRALASCKKLSGFCYTQLYDVEQERNGFYRYDRSDKLTETQKEEIRRINLAAESARQ